MNLPPQKKNQQPLRNRDDYAVGGMDQLERQFINLPDEDQELVKDQFNSRIRRNEMDIDRIAAEILTNEKTAVSPPGWSGTTKAMKKHKNITNPWALSWWLAKQKPGAKWGPGGKGKLKKSPEPHYKPEKKKKKKKSSDYSIIKIAQIADEIIDDIMTEPMMPAVPITQSSKKYSTEDSVKTDAGYITIRTNYDEKDGEPILEEYVVDKDGDVQTYDNRDAFIDRLMDEGLL